jgi:hypothetical protein
MKLTHVIGRSRGAAAPRSSLLCRCEKKSAEAPQWFTFLLKREPLPHRASTPDVKQTLKPDLLEGANSFGLGFLPPRVWRRLDEARRVTPGERQKKGIENSICVCTFVIAILHGSLCDGFVSSAVTSFQRCFFCNLYKASFGGLPSHCCQLEQQLTVNTYNAT